MDAREEKFLQLLELMKQNKGDNPDVLKMLEDEVGDELGSAVGTFAVFHIHKTVTDPVGAFIFAFGIGYIAGRQFEREQNGVELKQAGGLH